jgi:predicted RNase H-like nuclease (RuvC/YqgF family)
MAAIEAQEAIQGVEWINLTQAAKRLGWPRERLRSAARRRTIETRRAHNSGELLVLLTSELLAQAQPTEAHGPTRRSTREAAEADGAREHLASLETSLDDAEAQVANLRAELAKTQAERDAAKAIARAEVEAMRQQLETEVAARNAVIEELKAGLEHERARSERLDGMLAELRRPWWRRWLNG